MNLYSICIYWFILVFETLQAYLLYIYSLLVRLMESKTSYFLLKAAVWLKYAECLNSLGNLKDAVHAFKRVIELAPSHMNARVSLSAIQQQLGRPEEALKVLQQGEFVFIQIRV